MRRVLTWGRQSSWGWVVKFCGKDFPHQAAEAEVFALGRGRAGREAGAWGWRVVCQVFCTRLSQAANNHPWGQRQIRIYFTDDPTGTQRQRELVLPSPCV